MAGLRRRGTGFRSRHEALDTTTPGGRLVFCVFAALAEFIGGLIVEGFALSGAATGQHGPAAALLGWLATHRTPRSAQILAGSAGCAVPRSHATSDARFPGW